MTTVSGILGVKEFMEAESPREKVAAAVSLAILLGTLGTARFAASRQITLIGSRRDTLPLSKVKGFNVLNVPDEVWSKELNIRWLLDAVNQDDVIMLTTNADDLAIVLQNTGKVSQFLELELPLMSELGFVKIGPFMVRLQ